VSEVLAVQQQRLIHCFRPGIRETITKVQLCRMSTAQAEIALGFI